MEAAEQPGNFKMHWGQTSLEDGFLAQAHDSFVHLSIYLSDNFFDACRMDSAIGDEADHGFAGDFAADGIKAGEEHSSRSIVDQDSDAGSGFKCADVSAFTANDSTFDFVAPEGDGSGGGFESLLTGIALDGDTDDTPGLFFSLVFRFIENGTAEITCIFEGILLDALKELGTSLGLAQSREFLELNELMAQQFSQFVLLLFNSAQAQTKVFFLLGEVLLGFDEAS